MTEEAKLHPAWLPEYRAVRNSCGFLDLSSRACLLVTGSDRVSWLQGMVSNDVRLLGDSASRIQGCILDATGHMLADLAIIRHPGGLLIDTDQAIRGKVLDILNRFIITEDVEILDRSDDLCCISIQGPLAVEVSQAVVIENYEAIAPADHTGSGGLDLYVPAAHVADVLDHLTARGAIPVGEEAGEALRVEAGIPRYGVDMDVTTIPLEAGLEGTHISYTKGCYVGQEIIARIQSRGHTNRALTGFLVDADTSPNSGDRILSANSFRDGDTAVAFGGPTAEDNVSPQDTRDVGWITSTAYSPTLIRQIALGYLRHELRAAGTRLNTDGGIGVEVTYLPFVPRAS